MDGSKKPVGRSIRFLLSAGVSGAILVMALVAGGLSFIAAFDEANELQDSSLRQTAWLVDHVPAPDEIILINGSRGSDNDTDLLILNLSPLLDSTLYQLPDGLHTLEKKGETYRGFIRTLTPSTRVAVLQKTELRDEIAYGSAVRTVLPLLILVPVLMLTVALLVNHLFRPIKRLSSELDSRGELALHRLDSDNLPDEIQPFASAINRMFQRVSQAMDTQQRFLADAAHELRSPMAALSLQAERLAVCDLSDEAQQRLKRLQLGIDRSAHLLTQLLSMARAQSQIEQGIECVSVAGVCKRVLEDLIPLAEQKGIDLGVRELSPVQFYGNPMDLQLVVRNLMENAVRYTPTGGLVDLSVTAELSSLVLMVEDNGPGIAPENRHRVFDAFVRLEEVNGEHVAESGSGLGLAIVKELVNKMNGQIELLDSDRFQTGLRVKVILPLARQSGPSV